MEARLSDVSAALAPATQTAAQLPGATDLDFHCTIDPLLRRSLDETAAELGALAEFVQSWAAGEASTAAAADLTAPSQFSRVSDLVDRLLECTDTYLDEYAGRRPIPGAARETHEALPTSGRLPRHILQADIPRPQDKFSRRADNSDAPWRRELRAKPNARVPLGWLDPAWDVAPDAVVEGQYGTEGDARLNPYHVEIYETPVPAHALAPCEPKAPPALDLAAPDATRPTPYAWVRTAAELDALRAHLEEERVREIAVDLEHNSLRSYQGIVCLMQISTRWGDWIVDTLVDEVREHAECLNAAFTHPDKVLVLHGADHDVLWLQRDLGLYVTNLFDTYHATNVLPFSTHSLAYLLQRYVDFEPDKRYQLADWRIRPLPREMLFYARSDTHSLLYVYDCLREELRAQGGPQAIREVFARSRATASKVYAKRPWDAGGESSGGWRALWFQRGGDLARASRDAPPGTPLSREERLVRRLHAWRDDVAREEDESPHWILGAQALMALVWQPPKTKIDVGRRVPTGATAVRARAAKLVRIVRDELLAWEDESAKRFAKAEASEVSSSAPGEDLGEAVSTPAPLAPPEVPDAVRDARLVAAATPRRQNQRQQAHRHPQPCSWAHAPWAPCAFCSLGRSGLPRAPRWRPRQAPRRAPRRAPRLAPRPVPPSHAPSP